MEFSRQEYWSRLPFSSPGIFPTQGLDPHALHWQTNSFTTAPPGKPPYWSRMGPRSIMTGVLIKGGHSDTEAHTQGECHLKMKAEIRVMEQKKRNTRDCQQTPDARREARNRFSLLDYRRNQPHSGFSLVGLSTPQHVQS